MPSKRQHEISKAKRRERKKKSQQIAVEDFEDLLNSPEFIERISLNVTRTVEQRYVGPTPPPDMLERYEKILPGSANRTFKMAEKEQEYRHFQNKLILEKSFELQMSGLIIAGILGLSGIIGGFWLLILDKNVAGYSSLITSVAILIGTAVYRHKAGQGD